MKSSKMKRKQMKMISIRKIITSKSLKMNKSLNKSSNRGRMRIT
jgi:hypothetical protein